MSELCSEVENMNISREYFFFLKDIYSDYSKYIKQYRIITSDYIKKLAQLHEKFSYILCDLNRSKKKYKNIKTKFIYSMTSIVPRIIKQRTDSIGFLIKGIDTSLKKLENTLKEKTEMALKYQDKYDEARNNLLKNYKNIDKYKNLFMSSMGSSEDLILKFYNNIEEKEKNKKEKKDKKDKNKDKIEKVRNSFELSSTLNDQVNNSITNSKKLEKQYLNSFETIEEYEKQFNKISEESIENIKQLSCDLTISLKDIIFDFIILLKNTYQMPLSEIDTVLPEIADFKEYTKFDEIINESYKFAKKLSGAKPKKYKLKCFNQPATLNGKYNPNNHIVRAEDGFEELIYIDDISTYLTIKEIFEKFELVDNQNFDLELEKEKLRTKELSEKLLSFDTKPISDNNILLSEEEIKELTNLLDKHYNRILFLQTLSTFRTKGLYDFPMDIYKLINQIFYTILSTVERDKDFHCAKNVIILSQTYYHLDNGKKKYLQEELKKYKLFSISKFWKEYIEYSIEKEIVISVKSEVRNGTLIKENQKESDDMYANIVFAQLVPLADNMIEFGIDRKKIKEIIKPIIKHYNMNEELINTIDNIIHKNSERQSIFLREEIKQFDPNLYLQNVENNNKNKDDDENISNQISDEKNRYSLYDLKDINDDENEENLNQAEYDKKNKSIDKNEIKDENN